MDQIFHQQNLNEGSTFLFTSESVGEGHPGESMSPLSLSLSSDLTHVFHILGFLFFIFS